jgi:hypothetical protein
VRSLGVLNQQGMISATSNSLSRRRLAYLISSAAAATSSMRPLAGRSFSLSVLLH